MRAPLSVISVTLIVVATHALSDNALAQTSDQVAKVLSSTREALGGEARIASIKTFVVSGRTRQIQGENLVPIEFEISAELPDKYSRRDEIPARDTPPTTTGFNGDALIQVPAQPPPGARGGGPAPTPEQLEAARRARVATIKQDFARLMLAMFATSYASFPLTFDYVGQAEAPQGKADVIDVKGPANFAARWFIDAQTHLPIMMSWQARTPPAPRRGGAPPAATPPASQSASQPAPVEHRLYFADYREADGLRLPFRIRRAVGGETTEETTFDRFRLNARIDPRRFETGN